MSVDCSSVVAYGHILIEEEYYLLEKSLVNIFMKN